MEAGGEYVPMTLSKGVRRIQGFHCLGKDREPGVTWPLTHLPHKLGVVWSVEKAIALQSGSDLVICI